MNQINSDLVKNNDQLRSCLINLAHDFKPRLSLIDKVRTT